MRTCDRIAEAILGTHASQGEAYLQVRGGLLPVLSGGGRRHLPLSPAQWAEVPLDLPTFCRSLDIFGAMILQWKRMQHLYSDVVIVQWLQKPKIPCAHHEHAARLLFWLLLKLYTASIACSKMCMVTPCWDCL